MTDEDSEAANSSVLWREENAPGEESTQGEATGGLEGGGVVLTQDPWVGQDLFCFWFVGKLVCSLLNFQIAVN